MKRILFVLAMSAAAAACGGKSSSGPTTPPEPALPTTTQAPTGPSAPAEPAPPTEEAKPAEPAPPPAPKKAVAKLEPTKKTKSKVTGTIEFTEVPDGVEVVANVEGLTPGDHGYHVHEKGDCSAPDASSAGAHFNPSQHKHGGPEAAEHHEGDFGNLTAGKDGKATKTFTMKGITLGEGETSIVGKGFIVHAKKDDLKSQPAGNAGDRVACGVIEAQ
ncbi:MAG: superoxide dismutase family protein [Kofleriaceae bacterium]|nr:superoxide dismutase family protein [Kofleriaceae bacterium]